MTIAKPGQFSIRVHPLVYWLLSGMAAGVGVVVASPLLSDGWRLFVGTLNAVLVLLVARAQPAGRDCIEPPPKSKVPRGPLSAFVLLAFVLPGCSLLVSRPTSPSEFASCPIGKVCEDDPGVPTGDCRSLDDAHVGLSVAAMATAGAAGVVGGMAPAWPDDEDAVMGLSISGAGLAFLSGIFEFADGFVVRRFVQWCGGISPP